MSDSAIFNSLNKATTPKLLHRHNGSDNVCIDNLSISETEGLSDRTTCGACGRVFRPDFKGQKFCDGPCYHESLRVDLAERFWQKIDRRGPDDCWLWIAKARLGNKGTFSGYGSIIGVQNGKKRPLYSHRVAWELTNGPIPDGLFVLHRCDVSLCCNPGHLFLGTQQVNLEDARIKGRLDESRPRTVGALTPEERLRIFRMPNARGLCTALARQYGVTKSCISAIRRGRFVPPALDDVFERVPSVQVPILGEVS